MTINFFHGDCMEYMKDKPDGYYDLAVVDPPYGGGGDEFSNRENRFGDRFDGYGIITPKKTPLKQPKTRQINHMMGGKLFSRYGITPPAESGKDGRNMGGEVQPARGCL